MAMTIQELLAQCKGGIGMTERNVPKVMLGAKTETRRIEACLRALVDVHSAIAKAETDRDGKRFFSIQNGITFHKVYPRHQVGDYLYVKEALEQYNVHKSRPVFAVYKTDKDHVWTLGRDFRRWQSDDGKPWENKVIPARYMPRSAARTFIEITDVRCERVQDISVEDVKAEGCRPLRDHVAHFQDLWNETNGKDAWERNDWTFAYTFKIVEPS